MSVILQELGELGELEEFEELEEHFCYLRYSMLVSSKTTARLYYTPPLTLCRFVCV